MSPLPPPPPETRIVRRPISANELEFLIPATERGVGGLILAAFWNAMAWLGFLAFLSASIFKSGSVKPVLIMLGFVIVGGFIAWSALMARYATQQLSLTPMNVRLRREIFGRSKIQDLASAEIVNVQKKEFYKKNYRPVFGILIESGKGKICFGTGLTDLEKEWLCGEIWKFLQPRAPGLGELKLPE